MTFLKFSKKIGPFFILLFLQTQLVGEEKGTLHQYQKNVFSQCGEDGIIEKIFDIIGVESKVCVEFGAWDGFNLSNTAHLWAHNGWRAILIESEPSRFNQLVKNVKGFNCVPICSRVGFGAKDSIEAILRDHSLNEPIDLLSIDIDSDDYYVFNSLKEIRPRLVICEFNPTMPAHLDIYPEPGKNLGCSVSALVRVGREKGYVLVAITDANCLFVRSEDAEKFTHFDTSIEKMRIDKYLAYLITNYNGEHAVIVGEGTPFLYGGIKGPLNDKVLGNVRTIQ